MNTPSSFSAMPESMRPPDWRHSLAIESVRKGQVLLPLQGDALTLNLARYLRQERECTNDAARLRHHRRQSSIAQALDIFRDRTRSCALSLESLVLARERTQTVAERCGISEAVVKQYREAFFSVGSFVDNTDYILRQAIEPELDSRDHGAGRRYAMKLCAYFCGARALEEFFLVGEVSLSKGQWWPPEELIQKMASAAYLQQAAGMMVSGDGAAQGDPECSRQHLEQVIERMRAQRVESWPRNIIERETRRTMSIS